MPESLTVTRLLTPTNDPAGSEIVVSEEEGAAPGTEILLKPDLFSLTTNNITYAAFGEAMKYWAFFPSPRPGFGHMPVWGFADVVQSSVPGIDAGERFYGYFPIASHVRMLPERIADRGFHDAMPHRRELASAYNMYMRCSADPAYAPEREGLQALFRPLFVTAFILADFLRDNDFFGAERVVISSASAKTAYGTAFCLGEDPVEVIALTSPRNAGFVRSLGCYAETVAYDDIETIDRDRPTLYVDFSGDYALRARIHRHFGPALVHDSMVGSAAGTGLRPPESLPGPAPQFFFAPHQIKKRNSEWGPSAFAEKFNAVQTQFLDRVARPDAPWIRIIDGTGFEAAGAAIRDLAENGGDPSTGHIIHLP